MEEIYKLNKISLNQQKSQFCLCYNNGIRTYGIDDFKQICSSKNRSFTNGNITVASLLHEYSIVIFSGSESSETNNNKKLIIYDLISQKEINSTSFQSSIINIVLINKFIIVNLEKEIQIFIFKDKKDIVPISSIPLANNIFEIWEKSVDLTTKIFLAFFSEKEIIISSYVGDDWSLGERLIIKNPFTSIQGMFYLSKINQLFVVDENAYYITSFETHEGKPNNFLYRGRTPGLITSMTLLNKNYIALSNANRTIHIFDLDINNNAFSFSNIFNGLFYGQKLIYSCIKIPFEEFIDKKESEFYALDFQKKGAIITSIDNEKILNVIAYNGYAYKIKIDFTKKTYDIILKEKYTSSKLISLNIKEKEEEFKK